MDPWKVIRDNMWEQLKVQLSIDGVAQPELVLRIEIDKDALIKAISVRKV